MSDQPSIPRRRLLQTAGAAAALGWPMMGAIGQSATLPEYVASRAPIPDYEFDWGRNGRYDPASNFGTGNARFAFSTTNLELWLGYVDFETGVFLPEDGRAELIDTYAANATAFGNGPEWLDGDGPSEIVYTRYLPGEEPSPATAGLGRARMVNGSWQAGFFPDSIGRASPAGSLERGDTAPRIHYVASDKSGIYWRSMDAPDVERVMPIDEISKGNARRWVPGTRKVIFQGRPPGSTARLRDQVFTYDTDTGEVEQLTFDDVGKLGAYAWRAPEYGGEVLFLTMPQFRQQILIYRKIMGLDGVGRWTVIKTIGTPSQLPFVWSPEVFTHNGRTWIFFQLSASPKFWDLGIPTHIAMSGIDPLRQDLRMLTNDSTRPRVRLDPEHFITARGPMIYYTRIIPQTSTRPAANDGVWFVDTRLGPPR